MTTTTSTTGSSMKAISLVVLTLHSALLGLSMRYARTRPGDMFLSSTAVLMSEICKLVLSLLLVFNEEGKSISRAVRSLHEKIIQQPWDTCKVCVPSLLYVIQNNLLYLSASNLDAATYQVTYQLKILTTAIFSVIVLRRQLISTQWAALVVLTAGVMLVQLADTQGQTAKKLPVEQNRMVGFAAALAACILSGLAGIIFEKILKGSDVSVWMRNTQLSLLSLPLGLFAVFVSDSRFVMEHGFFHGYDWFVIYVVLLQAAGGIVVALVVKYADNILKGFATSLAIVISCITSVYLFDFMLSAQFVFGVFLVISPIYMYNYKPRKIKKLLLYWCTDLYSSNKIALRAYLVIRFPFVFELP